MYLSLPSDINSFLRSSNLLLANFKKINPNTTCLYSEGSTEPRSMFAESQRVSSMIICFVLSLEISYSPFAF